MRSMVEGARAPSTTLRAVPLPRKRGRSVLVQFVVTMSKSSQQKALQRFRRRAFYDASGRKTASPNR